MKFSGNTPSNPYEPMGSQGFPTLPNAPLAPGYSPGTIRDTLGSKLKANGIFQKDGQVQNLRGGFIGPKQAPFSGPAPGNPWQVPPVSQGMGSFSQPQLQGPNQGMNQARQLILQAAQEGIAANGVATISPDNSFLLVANLPPPQTFLGQGQLGQYAAYLVDNKGKMGFLAGVLRPVGNGVYRAHFQSPVPLYPYTRTVVSVEGIGQLGQAPNGPIILKVQEPRGPAAFLSPMKNTAQSFWGKVSSLFRGKKPPVGPEALPGAGAPQVLPVPSQMGVPAETMMAPEAMVPSETILPPPTP
ncbi:hypothetical protein [Desulfosporosinus sp. FKA]|uniref:hypothetical protein n=1 Tax=Desulfosporosinus sp. FKA TaxID=1969834 RepID=UPI000B49F987|nr:hypothetical protein [Desulfosporosinus sp. FKA]